MAHKESKLKSIAFSAKVEENEFESYGEQDDFYIDHEAEKNTCSKIRLEAYSMAISFISYFPSSTERILGMQNHKIRGS